MVRAARPTLPVLAALALCAALAGCAGGSGSASAPALPSAQGSTSAISTTPAAPPSVSAAAQSVAVHEGHSEAILPEPLNVRLPARLVGDIIEFEDAEPGSWSAALAVPPSEAGGLLEELATQLESLGYEVTRAEGLVTARRTQGTQAAGEPAPNLEYAVHAEVAPVWSAGTQSSPVESYVLIAVAAVP